MSCSTSRKSLSKAACLRIQKELMEWEASPPPGFKHKVSDDLQSWVVEVVGAPGTLYESETYQLQLDFPENYPMEAPQVIFLHPAPMHPHIYSNGHICLDILYDSWTAAMTVSSICVSILSMLSSSPAKVPLHCFLLLIDFSTDYQLERHPDHSHFACSNALRMTNAM
ncbi:putative ubiquitin-conjugating enzyme E2 16 [Nymphaea thermarum]|nr:putative ubiquitin-conjugating enzyme E2 16 [Nymphaea thermarum]